MNTLQEFPGIAEHAVPDSYPHSIPRPLLIYGLAPAGEWRLARLNEFSDDDAGHALIETEARDLDQRGWRHLCVVRIPQTVIPVREPVAVPRLHTTPEAIIEAVRDVTDQPEGYQHAEGRTAGEVFPRQLAMFLIRRHCRLSAARIGELFDVCASNVAHAVKRFEVHARTYRNVAEAVNAVERRLAK